MKKIVFVALVSGIFSNLFASKYICYRYVNGKSTGGYIKVYADSKSEAEKKSLKKYRDELDYTTDYTKCKLDW